jgi:hypothetical protein
LPCVSPKSCDMASYTQGQTSAPEGGDALPIALALELTWQPRTPLPLTQWAGIAHVLRKRAEAASTTLDVMAGRYCTGLRTPDAVAPASRWKLHITPSREQPDEWPSNLAWSAWRPGCVALFEFVAAFERGEVADPHPRARHFGGAKLARDHARCVRMGVVGRSGNTEFCGAVGAEKASGR